MKRDLGALEKLLLIFVVFFIVLINSEDRRVEKNIVQGEEAKIKETSLVGARSFGAVVLSKLNLVSEGFKTKESKSAVSIASGESPSVFLPLKPRVSASIYVLSDLDKSENILEKNEQSRWPVASLTKLMTALIAIENMAEARTIFINEKAVSEDGEAGGLKVGETYSVHDLVRATLLLSSNDAAYALAEGYGLKEFVSKMNEKARGIGMRNTFFKDPTGLSTLNQASAGDLKIFMSHVYKSNREILKISRETQSQIQELNSGRRRTIFNINRFSGRDDFLGGKTGFITDSGGNLVSLFSRNGRPLFILVMNADDRFAETLDLLYYYDKLNK